MNFAENLKDIRTAKGITQKQLANACNLSPQCISALETGRNNPTASSLAIIANALQVDLTELLEPNEQIFTDEEQALGIRATKKVTITPDEDDLLYYFRELGKLYGKEMQHAQISAIKNLVEIRKN